MPGDGEGPAHPAAPRVRSGCRSAGERTDLPTMSSPTTALPHGNLAIVIVDDARTSRAFFQRALVPAGYTDVRIADSGSRALDLLAERPADVVLADWMMPEMDGLELTERIRARDEDEGRYTAIILSTAREGMEALVEAFRHGVDDFLRKPFDARELAARVFAAGNQASTQNMLLETGRTLARDRESRTPSWSTDADTGLGNNDYFEAQLTTHLMETSMRGGVVCCALVEIVGPAAESWTDPLLLGRIGRRMMRAVRPTDAVCRLHDNRFGLVMSAVEASGFQDSVFNRLRREVTGRAVWADHGPVEIDLRTGFTLWEGPGGALAPADLIARAERDLADDHAAG